MPLTRTLWAGAVSLWVLISPGVVAAQLPIPQLGGPEFRFAGNDPLVDQIEQLAERVEQTRADRRAEIAQVTEAAAGSSGDNPGLKQLLSALKEEQNQLALAGERAADGLAQLKLEIPVRIDSTFTKLLEAAEEAERLALESRQHDAQARRLAAVGAAPRSRTASTSIGARLADEAERIRAAKAEATLAKALLTQAKHRVVSAQVAARRVGLVIRPKDVELAKKKEELARTDLAEAKRELERLRAKLALQLTIPTDNPMATLRRKVAEVQLENGLRAVANARAREARAQAERLALMALFAGTVPNYPPELGSEALSAELAAIGTIRVEVEGRLAEARAALRNGLPAGAKRLTLKVRDELEDMLASLAEESEHLSSAIEIERLLQKTNPIGRTPEEWGRALGLTAIVLLVAALLLAKGLPALNALDKRLGVKVRLARGDRGRSRMLMVLALFYPVVVALACAAVLVWPVWNLPITFGEALSVTDRPLFYVDKQAISVLSLFKLILTVWVTMVVSRLVRDFLNERVFRQLTADIGFATTLSTFVHYSFLFVGLSVGLRFVGVGLSSLALLAGVLGIGIGFGLRNITENFISGLIVLIERPIQVGDWIDLDGRIEGQVKSIRARSTTLQTRDNISIIIPNSEFVGRQVTNWSHGDPKVRLQIPVGVVYGSDTDLVRRTLLEVAERHGRVLSKPPPEVQFRAFAASSLDFLLLVWIDEQHHRFRIESDLRFAIDAAFRRKGVVIAFPQIDVHLKSIEADVFRFVRPGPEEDKEPVVLRVPGDELEVRRRSLGQGSGPAPLPGPGNARSRPAGPRRTEREGSSAAKPALPQKEGE